MLSRSLVLPESEREIMVLDNTKQRHNENRDRKALFYELIGGACMKIEDSHLMN